jgi:hypothetical protein
VRKAVGIIKESLEEFDTVSIQDPACGQLATQLNYHVQIDHIPGDEGDEHDTKIELED